MKKELLKQIKVNRIVLLLVVAYLLSLSVAVYGISEQVKNIMF